MQVAEYQLEFNDRHVVQLSTTKQGRHHVLLTDKKKGVVYNKGSFVNSALEKAQNVYDELKKKYKIGA